MRESDSVSAGMSAREYVVCGISFQNSPVEVRERVAISPQRLPEALQLVREQPGVRECMVLSTCNRTELYLAAEDWLDGKELFLRFARSLRDFDLAPMSDQIYVLTGSAAITHLFRVAASLDSLVVGEPQILGQTKTAFREAENQGCIGRDLHHWIPRAFAAAKQVRNETGIAESAVSVSFAAVQLAKKIFEDLSGKSVVLLGAGKMCELAALHLKEAGASSITVANRTFSRAEELAAKCSGTAAEFEQRGKLIAEADVVICSTDAPQYILCEENVGRRARGRAHRPLLILDMSVPRNVDPSVSAIEGVYLFNIDDLDSVVHANRENRQAEAVLAEAVLREAVENFLKEESESQMAPAIAAIRNQVRSICLSELGRFEQRMPGLSAAEREELEMMLHRIAQKVVHPAIMELKSVDGRETQGAKLSLVEKLFGVDRKASTC